jgi:hypothetical protein
MTYAGHVGTGMPEYADANAPDLHANGLSDRAAAICRSVFAPAAWASRMAGATLSANASAPAVWFALAIARGYGDTLLNPLTGDSLGTDVILIKGVK